VVLLTYVIGGGGDVAVGMIILNCVSHKTCLCIVEVVHLYFINLTF
jgi:hypothetical protein